MRRIPEYGAVSMDGGPVTDSARNTNAGKLAGIDPSAILQQLHEGKSLRDVAGTVGVSNVGLRAWLLRCDEDAYRDTITMALATRVAEADERLEAADDPVSIARAREIARFSRMDFERRRPNLYGPRQHVDMTIHSTDLGDRLRAAKERVVGTGSTAASSAQQPPKKQAIAQDLTSDSK